MIHGAGSNPAAGLFLFSSERQLDANYYVSPIRGLGAGLGFARFG
jgi:hypothetical protein